MIAAADLCVRCNRRPAGPLGLCSLTCRVNDGGGAVMIAPLRLPARELEVLRVDEQIVYQRLSELNPWRRRDFHPEIAGAERVKLATAFEDMKVVEARLLGRPVPKVIFKWSCGRCGEPFEEQRPASAPPGSFGAKILCRRCDGHVKAVEREPLPARPRDRAPVFSLPPWRAEPAAEAPAIGPEDLDEEAFARAAAELDEPVVDEPAPPPPAEEPPAAPAPLEAPPIWIAPPEPRLEEKETEMPKFHWTCPCGTFEADTEVGKAKHQRACDGTPWPRPCPLCKNPFKNADSLGVHVRRIHDMTMLQAFAVAAAPEPPPMVAPEAPPVPPAEEPRRVSLGQVAIARASAEAALRKAAETVREVVFGPEAKTPEDRAKSLKTVVNIVTEDTPLAPPNPFRRIAAEIGQLVAEKNEAYGDSFARAGEFLKLLYPDGIRPEQYVDALALVRIFDKQKRIASRKDAFGEDPYRDIAGYGILGAAIGERTKGA